MLDQVGADGGCVIRGVVGAEQAEADEFLQQVQAGPGAVGRRAAFDDGPDSVELVFKGLIGVDGRDGASAGGLPPDLLSMDLHPGLHGQLAGFFDGYFEGIPRFLAGPRRAEQATQITGIGQSSEHQGRTCAQVVLARTLPLLPEIDTPPGYDCAPNGKVLISYD